MFKDRAIALRQQAAEEIFVRLRKDRAHVSAQLGPLLAYLEAHLFDPDLTVETWMFRCGIRDKALTSRFAHELGHTPWEYLTCRRLEVAATLLRTSDLKLWRIGTVVGYSGAGSFSRAFKRWAGCSPTVYRKRSADPRRPKLVPAPLIDAQELERAMVGRLAVEKAEQLHRRLNTLTAQLETAYPELRGSRTVAKPVVGAELLETTMAEQLWSRLRTRPFEEQRALVKSQFAFCTPAFFELLLGKSREEGRQDRQRGVEVAKLALESLEAIEGLGNQLPNFRVRAWAWIGHTHRLAFEFLDAERACITGENEWDTIGLKFRDEQAVAELWLSKAALRIWQRDFDEALALMNPAISILKLHADSQTELVRALLLKGMVLGYKQDHRAALEVLREADELAAQHSDPYIRLILHAEVALASIRAGLLGEARASLDWARTLCSEVDNRFFALQLDWIEGLFEEQSGRPQHAQRKFIKAREGFGELGELGYYAVVSLDLAILGVKLGEVDELLTLAAEAATALESLKVHRELFVALKLLRTGLDTQRISLAVLEKARHAMEKARAFGFENLK